MLLEVDTNDWCQKVDAAEGLTVVFFYAPWCRNCKAVRPKLQRIEKKYSGEVSFYQANFKTETELCYQQRVFNFPTVHFYLPGIGRVARAVLTASNTDAKMKPMLDRLLNGRSQLEKITAEAIRPVVQYTELVSALQGLAEAGGAGEAESGAFGSGVNVKKESARLRGMVESDETRLAELEQLFQSLDGDSDGRVRLDELDTAAKAISPEGVGASILKSMSSGLKERLAAEDDDANAIKIDQPTFLSLMIDKAVLDFAAGEKALLPAFQAIDTENNGHITQEQLLTVIDNFCNVRPDADGCEVDFAEERPLRLAAAFDAFANEESRMLDYERFVAMVSGREATTTDECEVLDEDPEVLRAAAEIRRKYLEDEAEKMGERECFGEAVDEETGEDDPACDAWFFGEDPTAEKVRTPTDEAKIARLKEAGMAQARERAKRQAEMEAFAERMKAMKKKVK